MLGTKNAKIIREAICREAETLYGKDFVTLGEVIMMERVPISFAGYNVYCLQKQQITITVWVTFDPITALAYVKGVTLIDWN